MSKASGTVNIFVTVTATRQLPEQNGPISNIQMSAVKRIYYVGLSGTLRGLQIQCQASLTAQRLDQGHPNDIRHISYLKSRWLTLALSRLDHRKKTMREASCSSWQSCQTTVLFRLEHTVVDRNLTFHIQFLLKNRKPCIKFYPISFNLPLLFILTVPCRNSNANLQFVYVCFPMKSHERDDTWAQST